MIDIIIVGIVFALTAAIIIRGFKRKKGCSGNCSGCSRCHKS